MTVKVQLSAVGINTTTFDIYSNFDNVTPIASGISKMALLAGYYLSPVPDGATTIRVISTGTCTNYTDMPISGLTTTTTTTATPTTTTSTTATPTTTTTSSSTSTSTSSSTTTTTTTAAETYCVNWTAENEENIKMSTQGYIDFSAILAGRTIEPGPLSVGTITGYIIAGVGTFTCSIPMTFTTSQAQWNTDLLPVETDKVLTSLIYTVEVVFNDASEYLISDGQTNAIVIPEQMTSEYNNCPL